MTNIQILKPIKSIKSILTLTTASFALFAGEALLAPQAAFADDCLLDRNNNGDVDLSDDDGGANSFNVNSRLACGVDATATGDLSLIHISEPTRPY